MIDWSKLGWDEQELEGLAEIRIIPRLQRGEMIMVRAEWLDSARNIIREDTHIELLKPIDSTGEAGK